MKNNQTKSQGDMRISIFRSTDWDWLWIHSCALLIFGQVAFRHKSVAAFILIILFTLVFVVHDLSIVYKRGLYSNPPNSKFLKSYMLYMAVELMFTFVLGVYSKIWGNILLLLTFFMWMLIIIPRAIKLLNVTFYIVKRWSRVWTRTM
jgi:hypothetical protein